MGRRFERAYGVLQADKRLMDEQCKALMAKDLERKFSEYFERMGDLCIGLEKRGGRYHVSISFDAERIKQFRVLK